GLTEDSPTIKPYEEKEWAKLADNETVPVNVSITLLHALHQRWYATIKDLSQDEFERTVVHPEHGRKMTLWFLLGMYAWHGKHHVAHISALRKNKNW
ncbi:MAG: DinB family protein, partial [Bacteroidota bacterium]|nr:DinB family protein [Bacteroidota bacterium]